MGTFHTEIEFLKSRKHLQDWNIKKHQIYLL